jgi:5-methylthioadenosine/S-adenosylhomocysteine deaminase
VSAARALLLEDGLVVTLDDEGRVGRFTVAVRDGRIAGVLEPARARREFAGATRVSCRSRIVMPGLVNAHVHPELHLLKGALEEIGLHGWDANVALNGALRVLNAADGRPLQRAAIRAALIDAALGGTTCVATYGITTGAEQIRAEELRALGLRGAVTIRDATFGPPPPGLPSPAGDGLGGPIRAYRLHAEEALDDAELAAAAEAHARGERIVMHAAETIERVGIARRTFGTSTIRLLHRYGLLSPRVLLSHAIHVDAEERALIARAGAVIVASPSAEQKLGDGIGPFVDYLRVGARVALGTDAAVCNNGSDMFLECRQLGLSQKAAYGADALDAEQILHCATRHGARALGLDGRLGALARGQAADVILVDIANARLQPLIWQGPHRNVHANLVYAATGQDVTDVMVGGAWIVRRRRFLRADTRRAWRELARAANMVQSRSDEANGGEEEPA